MHRAFFDYLISAIFGLQLSPKSAGNAELTLGGFDASKVTGTLRFSSLVDASQPPAFWSLASSSISSNGKSLNTTLPIIFDSGTSNLVFEQNTTEVTLPRNFAHYD